MKKLSFIESLLIALTSFFTESFTAIRNIKSSLIHAISRHSNVPIIRMFHEALKSGN